MKFTLHQALFGYDGGHQLLAASARLPTDAKHLLAVATDSSGSAPATGFDQVYTGMPLPGTEFYALFSTWLAPEMSRPGCVWSHVLLVELADLAQLVDLGELRQLFCRPKKTDDPVWREPIHFASQRIKAAPVIATCNADCKQFLEALYVAPEVPAVIEAPDSGTYSDLVFAIWSQQWPRLRRSFRFSTGSFGDRGRSGPAFDLQIIPSGSRGAWQRGVTQTLPVTTSSPVGGAELSRNDWLKIAISDLSTPDQQGFRSFLHTHGLDVNEPRTAFARLAAAYDLLVLRPQTDWAERLRSIGAMFPVQSDAVRLKESLVAARQTPNVQENVEHASATVAFLFEGTEAAPYAGVSIDYSYLAQLLWKENRDFVISLLARLVRQKESPAGCAFADAVASTVDCAALKYISERHDELIPIIISHHPALTFEVETWHLPGHVQSQVFEALSRLSLSEEDWAKIVGAMLIAATYVAVREAVGRAKSCVMQGAFRWLEHPIAQRVLPSQPWREALAAPAAEFLGRENNLTPVKLAFIAWCIPPEAALRTLSADRGDVQNLASQLEVLPPPLRVPTVFLLTTIGLRAATDAGISLIVRSFYPLHDALASREYPDESWLLLSPQLPYLGRWSDWDRCEKLRRAVNNWLTQHVKVGNPLREAATTAERRRLARRVADSGDEIDDFID